MLICKGYDVGFVLVDHESVDAPKSAAMLHDPTGKHWPKCSLLVASFRKGRRAATDEELDGAPRAYFGRAYEARVGTIDTPPKALSEWTLVGDVTRVYYERIGTKAPGKYKHDMNAPRGLYHVLHLLKGKGRATLYRRGRVFRLDLPGGCSMDDRGIVWP